MKDKTEGLIVTDYASIERRVSQHTELHLAESLETIGGSTRLTGWDFRGPKRKADARKPQIARKPVATTRELAGRYRQELNSLLTPHIHQNRMDSAAARGRVLRHHHKLLARVSPRGKRNLVLDIEGAI